MIGLGNVLLGDDGFGPTVIALLQAGWELPAQVELIDAGTPGLQLLAAVHRHDALILIDAVAGSDPPGSIHCYSRDQLDRLPIRSRVSPHDPALLEALAVADLTDHGPSSVLVIGAIPLSIEMGSSLSAPVRAACAVAAERVVEELTRLGCGPRARSLRRSPDTWWCPELSSPRSATRSQDEKQGRHIEISGVVQGVGFRPWVCRLARAAGLTGQVRNDARGVTIDAFGSAARLDAFVRELYDAPPAGIIIDHFAAAPIPAEASARFEIVASATDTVRHLAIAPDRATCDQCLAEIFDPRDRRYRYPFTTCTHCGPRFTIAEEVPYDRAATTMARFAMCADCEREYHSPEDRRFHAEANACPTCGPRLRLLGADGVDVQAIDPLRAAAMALRSGLVVAVKGLGGFHLACDASASGVRSLRRFKRRDEKPFAIMVRDLSVAERVAELSDEERRLLSAPQRPIVLVHCRPDADLAPEVAPGLASIGLFLPYSPLHHLLLAEFEGALVMTSGNRGGEPLAYRDHDACQRLAAVAQLFLVHDREIAVPCDDSVARVIDGGPVLFRRARGYAPRAIPVSPVAQPVLACGAQQKNAICVAVDDHAYLGAHVGDLDDAATLDSFEASITCLERWLGVRPQVIAHDLHPDYHSTGYARARAGLVTVAVQHHHAHVVSAMAEHQLDGPVLGIAYDGTGYGTDGTVWGGELLLAERHRFERLATFRPLPLAGGETAVREVWRIALAWLDDALDHDVPLERIPLFSQVPARALAVARRMLETGVNVVRARGVGRYFDAVGALALGRANASHEGQIAMAVELAATTEESAPYPFVIDTHVTPWEIDLRPAARWLVRDVIDGGAEGDISARFHSTLIAATAACVENLAQRTGRLPVVLSGGCFQNARLTAGIAGELRPHFEVYTHHEVPTGDGGIALGQAMVADAIARLAASARGERRDS